MSSIDIVVAGYTDKAGRAANQDNIWMCPDLGQFIENPQPSDQAYRLSSYGAVLVVADGMGGMKSGEVASQLVVDTIRDCFRNMKAEVVNALDERRIRYFIENAIKKADLAVKEYSAGHPESHGMGSTLVLAWAVNGKLYVAWVGDSRAYCFNPHNDLTRLTHDHSLVQALVDNGSIAESEAFHHPQGNVILHSIGDTEDHVCYDLCVYDLHDGDIILLCSDGLCGLLNDAQLEDTIQNNTNSMVDTLSALWSAGQQAGWTDNATIALMRINGGAPAGPEPEGWKECYAPRPIAPAAAAAPAPTGAAPAQQPYTTAPVPPTAAPAPKSNKTLGLIIGAAAAAIVIVVAIGFFFLFAPTGSEKAPTPQQPQTEEPTTKVPAPSTRDTSAPAPAASSSSNTSTHDAQPAQPSQPATTTGDPQPSTSTDQGNPGIPASTGKKIVESKPSGGNGTSSSSSSKDEKEKPTEPEATSTSDKPGTNIPILPEIKTDPKEK